MSQVLNIFYERLPKSENYKGRLELLDIDSNTGSFRIEFEDRDLRDVAEQTHFLVRVLAATGKKFLVVSIKSAPGMGRTPAPIQLTTEQVNKLFESVRSARAFFAPIHITRNVKPKGD